ncbi:MAG TPA: GspH/FimT family pseudopilin [Gammaproteobacteria bacterium]
MRKDSGFTLIELLVTISVAAILIGVGAPSLNELVRNNRRAAAANALITTVQQARSTAASRGITTVLCHSANGSSCSGASDPDWSSGWLLFVDADADGIKGPDEDVLSAVGSREGVAMPSKQERFTFPPGFSAWINGGTVAVCIDGESNDRWIRISKTGRPRLATEHPDNSPTC